MQRTQKLFELIKSLSRAEKRYFSIYAERHVIGAVNYYKRLFDVINKMDDYDEERARAAFQGEAFGQRLSTEKVYLYNLIMRSLRSFNAGKSIDQELMDHLHNIDILERRGLYPHARDQMKKAKEKAESAERQWLRLHLLYRERFLVHTCHIRKTEVALRQVIDETKTTAAAYEEELQVRDLYDQIFLRIRIEPNPPDSEEQDSLHDLSDRLHKVDELQLQSVRARVYLHTAKALVYQRYRQFDRALAQRQEVVRLREENVKVFRDELCLHINALGNLGNIAMRLREIRIVQEVIGKLEALPAATFDERGERFQNLALLKLEQAINMGRTDEAPALVAEIEEGLEEFDTKINHARRLTLLHNLTILYFLAGSYERAQHWLTRSKEIERSHVRKDIQRFALMLAPLLNFELQRYGLIEAQLDALYRRLRSERRLRQFERHFLSFMRKAMSLTDQKALLQHAGACADKLEALIKDPKQQSFGLVEVYCWLRSKAEEQPIAAVFNDLLNGA